MSRTVLWILTVFLSLAMIALVGVQAYWFKNSIDAKEKQLGLVVNQVLGEISGELVRDETLMTILEELNPPSISHQSEAIWNFQIDGRSLWVNPNLMIYIEEKEIEPEKGSGRIRMRTKEETCMKIWTPSRRWVYTRRSRSPVNSDTVR